jgi:hypothetical protein
MDVPHSSAFMSQLVGDSHLLPISSLRYSDDYEASSVQSSSNDLRFSQLFTSLRHLQSFVLILSSPLAASLFENVPSVTFDLTSDQLQTDGLEKSRSCDNSIVFVRSRFGASSFVVETSGHRNSLLIGFVSSSIFAVTLTDTPSPSFVDSSLFWASPIRRSRDLVRTDRFRGSISNDESHFSHFSHWTNGFSSSNTQFSQHLRTDALFQSHQINESLTFDISSTFTQAHFDRSVIAERVVNGVSPGGWVGIGVAAAVLIAGIVLVLWCLLLGSRRKSADRVSGEAWATTGDSTHETEFETGTRGEFLDNLFAPSFHQSGEDDHWGPPFANDGQNEEMPF